MVKVRLVCLLAYLPFAAIDTVTLQLPDDFVVSVVLFNVQLPEAFQDLVPVEFDVAIVETFTDDDAGRLVTFQVTVGAVPLAAWTVPTPETSSAAMVRANRLILRGK